MLHGIIGKNILYKLIMGRKKKVPMKTVRINDKTWIEIPVERDSEEARKNFLRNMEISSGRINFKDKNIR